METLTKYFRDITKAAFARHGFAQSDLAGHWAEIVGNDLAAVSAPERVKWPRGVGEGAQKSGGTLVIKAAPGRGLDLQYQAPRIIARANSYFGYGAIAQIKVTQGKWIAPAASPRPLLRTADPPCNQQLAKLEDTLLKEALTRLGSGIRASGTSSPQGK